ASKGCVEASRSGVFDRKKPANSAILWPGRHENAVVRSQRDRRDAYGVGERRGHAAARAEASIDAAVAVEALDEDGLVLRATGRDVAGNEELAVGLLHQAGNGHAGCHAAGLAKRQIENRRVQETPVFQALQARAITRGAASRAALKGHASEKP